MLNGAEDAGSNPLTCPRQQPKTHSFKLLQQQKGWLEAQAQSIVFSHGIPNTKGR